MKKTISILLITMMVICSLSACASPAGTSGDDKISIVTTIFPEYDWVMNILGNNPANAEVTLLLDNGVDLHSYQPTADDIMKIAGTYDKYVDGELEDEKGFCAVATLEDIAKQDYILTPGRYVGIAETEDDGEPFQEKMTRLTSELSEMFKKSHELEEEIRKQLASIGFELK